MRWIVLMLLGLLVGCGSKDEPEQDTSPFAAAQEVVDQVASRHPDVKRLTLHAVPMGEDGCTQIASTMAARRGKPSDPEDLAALESGEETVLDEEGAVDVTVPIREVDGKPTAVAGVTITMAEGADRDALVSQARAVAKELEVAIQAAGKPLW
jgi:hypothetical protein